MMFLPQISNVSGMADALEECWPVIMLVTGS